MFGGLDVFVFGEDDIIKFLVCNIYFGVINVDY